MTDPSMMDPTQAPVDPTEYVNRLKAVGSKLGGFQEDISSHAQRITSNDAQEKERRVYELNRLFAELEDMGFDLSTPQGVNKMIDTLEERQPGSGQLIQNLFELLDPEAVSTPDLSAAGAQLPPELMSQLDPMGFPGLGQAPSPTTTPI